MPDRSWLHEEPENIVMLYNKREAAIARRQAEEERNPDTGLFESHPINCTCDRCIMDNYEPRAEDDT